MGDGSNFKDASNINKLIPLSVQLLYERFHVEIRRPVFREVQIHEANGESSDGVW